MTGAGLGKNPIVSRRGIVLIIVVLLIFSGGYFAGVISHHTEVNGAGLVDSAQSCSFVIFQEGSTTYARNGLTGNVDYSGTDASTVVQQAIDKTFDQGGGRVCLTGAFYVKRTIYLYPTVFLMGTGPGWLGEFFGSTIIGSFDGPVVVIQARGGKVANTGLFDLAIRPSNTSNGVGVKTSDIYGSLKDLFIQNVMIGYGGSHAIYLDSPMLKAWVSNVYAEYNGGAGIYISSGGLIADKFYAYHNKYGIYSNSVGDVILSQSKIGKNSNGGIVYEGTYSVFVVSLTQVTVYDNGYRQISITNANVKHLVITSCEIVGGQKTDYLIYLGGAGITGQIIANELRLNGATNYIYAKPQADLLVAYNIYV